MQNIIQISNSNINNKNVNTINARELHEFLEIKSKFSDWIQNRIKKYDFLDNVDYIHTSKILETRTGATIIQYNFWSIIKVLILCKKRLDIYKFI